MHIDTQKSRVIDNESAQVKALRGQVEKLERVVEDMKKRLPPPPAAAKEVKA